MRCIIQCFQPLKNKLEIITIKDDKIYYDDGRYSKVILDDELEVECLCSKIYGLIFSWKQEYIGERVVDGEKYLIEIDVNHKRKKYKVQNKFPANWSEFLKVKQDIIDYNKE